MERNTTASNKHSTAGRAIQDAFEAIKGPGNEAMICFWPNMVANAPDAWPLAATVGGEEVNRSLAIRAIKLLLKKYEIRIDDLIDE